jgi:hypothetical protein
VTGLRHSSKEPCEHTALPSWSDFPTICFHQCPTWRLHYLDSCATHQVFTEQLGLCSCLQDTTHSSESLVQALLFPYLPSPCSYLPTPPSQPEFHEGHGWTKPFCEYHRLAFQGQFMPSRALELPASQGANPCHAMMAFTQAGCHPSQNLEMSWPGYRNLINTVMHREACPNFVSK